MKGRPPDPTRGRRGTGNRALTEQRPGAISVPSGDGLREAPAHLSLAARQAWTELAEDLRYVQGIKPMDGYALEALANLIAQTRELAEELALPGGMLDTRRVAAYRSHASTVVRLAEQFGLTPAARLRLGVKALEGMTMAEQLQRALTGD